jgi:hypothetical protein
MLRSNFHSAKFIKTNFHEIEIEYCTVVKRIFILNKTNLSKYTIENEYFDRDGLTDIDMTAIYSIRFWLSDCDKSTIKYDTNTLKFSITK